MSETTDFDYQKYLQLLKKNKLRFVLVALSVMTAAVIVSYWMPKIYMAKSSVYIEKKLITELLKGIAVTPSVEETIKNLNYSLTSRPVLTKVIRDLDLGRNKSEKEQENLMNSIRRNVEVVVNDKSIFSISYRNADPVLARDLVNSLVKHYIEENTSSKRKETSDANQFLSAQIQAVQQRLQRAEQEMNDYKGYQGGMLSFDEGKLFQEINTAQQKLYDLQLRRRHLEGLKSINRKVGTPLQSRLMALQKRLNELRVRYTERYPEVVQVESEIAAIKEEMKTNAGGETSPDNLDVEKAEAEIAAIRATEEGLRKNIASNQALLQKVPAAKGGLEKLELERNRNKLIYDQLVARLGQSEFTKEMEDQNKSANFKVVEPALLPTRPVSPNRVRIIGMGIAAGLAAGFGLLLLMDQLDKSVKTLDAVKSLGVPVLSVIRRIQDPVMVEEQRKKDVWFYACSAGYFCLILLVLVAELVQPSLIDSLLSNKS